MNTIIYSDSYKTTNDHETQFRVSINDKLFILDEIKSNTNMDDIISEKNISKIDIHKAKDVIENKKNDLLNSNLDNLKDELLLELYTYLNENYF